MAWIMLIVGMAASGAITMTVGYIYGIHRTDLLLVTFFMGCGLQLAMLLFWYVAHIATQERRMVEKFLEPRDPVSELPSVARVMFAEAAPELPTLPTNEDR